MTDLMLFDPFIDTDEDYFLSLIAKYQGYLLSGPTVVEWSGEGTSVRKQMLVNVPDLLFTVRRHLKRLNPDKYGYITTCVKPIFI